MSRTADFDTASMMSNDDNEALSDVETQELELLDFQQELVEPSYGGDNRIIISPTNSGKTYVAMAIAKVNFLLRLCIHYSRKQIIYYVKRS